MDKEGHILPVGEVWTPDVTDNFIDNITNKVIDNDGITNDVTDGVPENVTDVTDNVTDRNTAEKRRLEILHLMRITPKITMDSLVNILHVSRMTISRDINLLRANGKLRREGDARSGIWIVIE